MLFQGKLLLSWHGFFFFCFSILNILYINNRGDRQVLEEVCLDAMYSVSIFIRERKEKIRV